jgi:hypothetical protein
MKVEEKSLFTSTLDVGFQSDKGGEIMIVPRSFRLNAYLYWVD